MEKLKAWAKLIELAPIGIVITATLCCVALGVLFGWILFGRPHLITSTDKIGTVAEWIAAAGTWVIGAGAWWYAKESYNQRIIETYFAEFDRCQALNRRLTMIQVATSTAATPRAELEALLGGPFNANRSVRRSLTTLVSDTDKFRLEPSDIAMMDIDGQAGYISTRNRLDATKEAAQIVLDFIPNDAAAPPPYLREAVEDLRTRTDDAAEGGQALFMTVENQIARIRWPKRPDVLRE